MNTLVKVAAAMLLAASVAMPAMGQRPQRGERPRMGGRHPRGVVHHPKNNQLKRTNTAYLRSAQADSVGRQVLAYQRVTGGWPKNIDMGRPHTQAELDSVVAEKGRTDDSTTDNGATVMQMRFLAYIYQATGKPEYRDAFVRGVEYLLSGQYPEGGWPQFWPDPQGYQVHVTYNDHAMVNTMTLLRDVSAGVHPFTDMVDKETALRMDDAFARGIEWMLADQIRDKEGKLTVWCQQHDHLTHAPALARSYELPSYCSAESAGILKLLMSIPQPDERVREAVRSGMAWLDAHKIEGYRYGGVMVDGKMERLLTPDPEGKGGPLWARFYDLENAEPFVSDRDGVPVKDLMQIGSERRNGYGWYVDSPAELYPIYEKWEATLAAE